MLVTDRNAAEDDADREHPVQEALTKQRGVVVVWFSIVLILLLGFAGFAVDFGNWYWTASRAQKAADAAALAGVTYMPGNFAQAQTTALDLAKKNGFTDGVNASVVVANGTTPSQLKVTVTTTVTNYFTGIFGLRTTTISKDSVADYQGPVPMGSPQGFLGNQPVGNDNTDVNDVAWYSLSSQPQMWDNIAGPGNNKENGDQYAPRFCSNGDAGCTGGNNTEYDSNNYFYTIRVNSVVAGKDLTIQAFDPAFVYVGDTCTAPSGNLSDPSNTLNGAAALPPGDYPDASTRYKTGPDNNPNFCTGDELVNGPVGNAQGVTTKFTIRSPDATPWNNTDNPIISLASCQVSGYPTDTLFNNGGTHQTFPPYTKDSNGQQAGFIAHLLAKSGSGSNRKANDPYFASVFRRWVTLCKIPAASVQTGDYIIQVQTNTLNNTDQAHNRYALRAAFTNTCSPSPCDGTLASGGAGTVSLFAGGRMPIYMNASGSNTQFYLARVLPGTGNRFLHISLFDVGDAAATGTITIVDSNGNAFPNPPYACSWSRSDGASLNTSGCRLNNVNASNGFNGQTVLVDLPIPPAYTCTVADPNSCWVKIKFAYSSGGVTDTTTWGAQMGGDPVRIVK